MVLTTLLYGLPRFGRVSLAVVEIQTSASAARGRISVHSHDAQSQITHKMMPQAAPASFCRRRDMLQPNVLLDAHNCQTTKFRIDSSALFSNQTMISIAHHNHWGEQHHPTSDWTTSAYDAIRVKEVSQRLQFILNEFSMMSLVQNDALDRVQAIMDLIDECPDVVWARDAMGLLPIHIACQKGAPLVVVQHLLKVGPDTILSPTNDRQCMLPLHLACRFYDGRNQEKSRIIRFLCKSNPTSLHLTTSDGETALHLLCRNYFCTVKDVRFLSRRFPAALTIQSRKDGKTPLHIACEKQYMERKRHNKEPLPLDDDPSSSSSEIVHYLVKSQPSALQMPSKRGELPLHSCVKGLQPTPLIQFLLQQYPYAATCANRSGQTPLHLSALHPVPSHSTTQALLRACPNAAVMIDDRGKRPQLVETGSAP